jgi:hypothetical protein
MKVDQAPTESFADIGGLETQIQVCSHLKESGSCIRLSTSDAIMHCIAFQCLRHYEASSA